MIVHGVEFYTEKPTAEKMLYEYMRSVKRPLTLEELCDSMNTPPATMRSAMKRLGDAVVQGYIKQEAGNGVVRFVRAYALRSDCSEEESQTAPQGQKGGA